MQAFALNNPKLADLLGSPRVQLWVPTTIGIVGLCVGSWEINACALVVVCCCAIVFGIVRAERQRHDPLQKYWVPIATCALIVVIAQFVFVPFPFSAYHVIDRGGGDITYGGRGFISIFTPFKDNVRGFWDNQTISSPGRMDPDLHCIGTTTDGSRIISYVAAQLSLPFEGLPAAYAASGSQGQLDRLVRSELCERYANALAHYNISGLASNITIEVKAAEVRRGMNALGILYSGVVMIGDSHAYVAQEQ